MVEWRPCVWRKAVEGFSSVRRAHCEVRWHPCDISLPRGRSAEAHSELAQAVLGETTFQIWRKETILDNPRFTGI